MEFDKRYLEIKDLGAGNFGVVKLVKDLDTNELFACKEVSDVADILVGVREVDVMERIKGLHPNIVSLEGYYMTTKDNRYTMKQIMELCTGGSLEELLKEEFANPDKGVKGMIGGIYTRLENLLRITEALAELQKIGVYHMDIKTENILYRKPNKRIPEMCLCDFSNYYLHSPWKEPLTAPVGPIEAIIYRPPEVGALVQRKEYYDKIDVWAMGVVIAETMGAWGLIQSFDTRVVDNVSSMKALVDKIQSFRTQRKNGVKKGAPAVRALFPDWLFRKKDLGDRFGRVFSTSSMENDMVHSLLYAKMFTSPSFFEKGLEEAIRYFTVRKADKRELTIIDRIFKDVLPLCLKVSPKERISMRELVVLLTDILNSPVTSTEGFLENTKGCDSQGLWGRYSEPSWRDAVVKFYKDTRDVTIMYGRFDKISVPTASVLYAKRMAEEYITTTMEGEGEDSHEKILLACMFIVSELMDFIFPYEDYPWFVNGGALAEIAPIIKRVSDTLMGRLGTLTPNAEEREALLGKIDITSS
jgi:serine/threonine protein kinase